MLQTSVIVHCIYEPAVRTDYIYCSVDVLVQAILGSTRQHCMGASGRSCISNNNLFASLKSEDYNFVVFYLDINDTYH